MLKRVTFPLEPAAITASLGIAGFSASVLGAHADKASWALTQDAAEIIARMIPSLGAGYRITGDIAVHEGAVVEAGAVLKGPLVIGPGCFVAAGAYLRGGCWLERDCVIGPGAELKSSFVFAGTKLAHFNFVGDSILGAGVNLEAGAIIANHRNEKDGAEIAIRRHGEIIRTGVTKFGAQVGDGVRIGANAVIAPGAWIEAGTCIPRLALYDLWP